MEKQSNTKKEIQIVYYLDDNRNQQGIKVIRCTRPKVRLSFEEWKQKIYGLNK